MDRDTYLIYEAYQLSGKAEGKSLEDIAKKHNVDIKELNAQLEKGIKTEHEHTKDHNTANKIAMDHLFEDPKYYDKLSKIENSEQEEKEETDSQIHDLAKKDSREEYLDNEEDEERRLDPKCWKGYHKQGTKMKGGVRVNNCVKNEQEEGEYSRTAHEYAERIVGADVEDPKALAKYYLDNPEDVPEPLKHEVLKHNFAKILKYIDFTVSFNQRRKQEAEYKKKELERGPIHPDPEVDLPGSKQARYKPFYKYNPADYLPRQ